MGDFIIAIIDWLFPYVVGFGMFFLFVIFIVMIVSPKKFSEWID